MSRQYVHLSADLGTATHVGARKSRSPVLLSVDAAGAAGAGVTFHHGNDKVWLADGIPAAFLSQLEPAGRVAKAD